MPMPNTSAPQPPNTGTPKIPPTEVNAPASTAPQGQVPAAGLGSVPASAPGVVNQASAPPQAGAPIPNPVQMAGPTRTAAPAQTAVAPAAPPNYFTLRPIEEMYDWLNVLFYGDFGVGKTTMAATAVFVPDMQDVLFISLEAGEKALKEIKRWCVQSGIDPTCLMVVPVQTYKQFASIYEFLKKHIQFRDTNNLPMLRALEAQLRQIPYKDIKELEVLIPNPKKFRTVIVDSLSEAQKYCMYQILGIDPATMTLDAEPDQAQFQD